MELSQSTNKLDEGHTQGTQEDSVPAAVCSRWSQQRLPPPPTLAEHGAGPSYGLHLV